MRCLALHCRTFEYRLAQATPAAAPDEADRTDVHKNCLVIFVAVERGDGEREISRCAKDVRKLARKAGATSIAVNPFAHLTRAGAAPDVALSGCLALRDQLARTADVAVWFTSFGWIKEFNCEVLGEVSAQQWIEHPPCTGEERTYG